MSVFKSLRPAEREIVRARLFERLAAESATKKAQADLAKVCGVSPSMVSQVLSEKSKTRLSNPMCECLLKHWGLSAADVLGTNPPARREGPRQRQRPVMGAAGQIPHTLSEAIRFRLDQWSGETIDQLRDMARRTGLTRSVGAWIDCGDELDAIAASAGHDDAGDVPTGVRAVRKAK